ncbi:MAG: hypothetical protein PHW13_11200 [Methylococcales bacterium]|nr:hypothetical protein [Methylococcales bacterium]
MEIVKTPAKALDFSTWMRENLRANQSNIWRQIGLWSFTLVVAVFVAPRLI